MNLSDVPPSPINLKGYPRCGECGSEVAVGASLCGAHDGGSPPRDFGILRREIIRQIRGAVASMQNCASCIDLPLHAIRCVMCTWTRGAAMGIYGLAECLGWAADTANVLDMIAKREEVPGTQAKAMQTWTRNVHR